MSNTSTITKYLIYYKSENMKYDFYSTEITDNLAEWAITVALNGNLIIPLCIIPMTEDQATRWKEAKNIF